jgi:hypothetical protein
MNDFLIDEYTNQLKYQNGDFDFGDATKQNQKALLLANKNSYKENPMMGVGILASVDDDGNDLLRHIRIEMVRDGMTIKELKVIGPGKINLDAEYK